MPGNVQYKPKRTGKKWLEGAPEYIRSCFDNRGKTLDRYTITFAGSMWEPSLGRNVRMLSCGNDPRGMSYWGEVATSWYDQGHKVRWIDLPEHIRAFVIAQVELGRIANAGAV